MIEMIDTSVLTDGQSKRSVSLSLIPSTLYLLGFPHHPATSQPNEISPPNDKEVSRIWNAREGEMEDDSCDPFQPCDPCEPCLVFPLIIILPEDSIPRSQEMMQDG